MSSSRALQPRTLTDALLGPQRTHTRVADLLLIVLFSGFVALTAQVKFSLPFTPVPFTGQTLGVLLTGALLGARRGSLALALYLAEGALGAPVFAPGGAPGIARFFGPTGGYLLMYPLAAGVVGFLAERGWDARVWRAAMAMLVGNALIYVGGVAWLALFLGDLRLALVNGFAPFVVGDLLKIGLAAIALPGGWALLRRSR